MWFHMNFKIVFFYFCKIIIGFLIGIALNLRFVWGSMDILTILSLPIHEPEIFSFVFVLTNEVFSV